jgi:hypothetical protein
MAALTETVYLILDEVSRYGPMREDGTQAVRQFRISGLRQTRPKQKGAIVVRLNVSVDPGIFDSVSPTVNMTLEAGDVILPDVEITAGGE